MSAKGRNLRWVRSILATDLTCNAKLIAAAAGLKYADRQSLRDIRPGAPRLARDCSVSERTVYRALDELVAAGWLGKARKGHTGSASLYFGRWPPPKADEIRCAECDENVSGDDAVGTADGRVICYFCRYG